MKRFLSYSQREKDMIKHYIANQKDHHKEITFRDELESLMKEFGIQPDKWMACVLCASVRDTYTG